METRPERLCSVIIAHTPNPAHIRFPQSSLHPATNAHAPPSPHGSIAVRVQKVEPIKEGRRAHHTKRSFPAQSPSDDASRNASRYRLLLLYCTLAHPGWATRQWWRASDSGGLLAGFFSRSCGQSAPAIFWGTHWGWGVADDGRRRPHRQKNKFNRARGGRPP